MSIAHPTETFSTSGKEWLAGHDQLKPFLFPVLIFAVTWRSRSFTGLPQ
jgi:hypothetical protein